MPRRQREIMSGSDKIPAHPGVPAGSGPLVLKVLGTDAQGRRAAAWAVVDPDEKPGRAVAGQPATIAR